MAAPEIRRCKIGHGVKPRSLGSFGFEKLELDKEILADSEIS